MQRCIELAQHGAGSVAPNPMVGAVLVYDNKIIGEGFHERYGEAHAEVNCIRSVAPENLPKIKEAVLYVSLEPCAHFGKTPPCADLIIRQKIPAVVIGCRDPFPAVNGKGIEKLLAAGITVIEPMMEKECLALNRRFFTFHQQHRPYIILKWAQSSNARMAGDGEERLLISNPVSNRLVHRWRSEEAAIMVGTQTALLDNPQLNNRLWSGSTPVRIVLDRHLRLPGKLHLFDGQTRTIVLNDLKQELDGQIFYHRLDGSGTMAGQISRALFELDIQSVLIEGGARLLQSFFDEGLFDEVRVITNRRLQVSIGLSSPEMPPLPLQQEWLIEDDLIQIFTPAQS